MKKFYFFIISSLLMTSTIFGQSEFAPVTISTGEYLGESIPLRDFERAKYYSDITREVPINNGLTISPRGNMNSAPNNGDPLYENNNPFRAPQDLLLSYDAFNASQCGCAPGDPTGAVGPNHYVHAVNMSVVIYDKDGNIDTPAVSLGSFFGNGVNNGDPIVMYDQLEDRWFISQFIVSTDEVIIAISTTPDPGGTYHIYEFGFTDFPDYPHYAVYPDAYYLSINMWGGNGEIAVALERDVMIAGGPNPQMVGFSLPGNVTNPFSIQGHMPVNISGTSPPAGVPGYFMNIQDDQWSGVSDDHIKIWEVELDWVTPANSTISAPTEIMLADFETTFFPFGVGDIRQPSTTQKIDANGGTLGYMPNYRSFAGHNSLVLTFTVDINGQNDAGVRWVELRNTGSNGPFSVYQEGTWAFDDGESRFFASSAIDADGNIAIAYSLGSENTPVSLYFTGRMEGDPLGQMSYEEQEIVAGVSFGTSNRYNDYTQMSIDPDGETFWFVSTYFKFVANWHSRIAKFNLDGLPILGDDAVSNIISYDVYPINDSYHEIKLMTQSLENDVLFRVTDVNGREVANGALELTSRGNTGTFSTANLSTGVYMVSVYNSNFMETKKIAIK